VRGAQVVFHPYRPMEQYMADVKLPKATQATQTAWHLIDDSSLPPPPNTPSCTYCFVFVGCSVWLCRTRWQWGERRTATEGIHARREESGD